MNYSKFKMRVRLPRHMNPTHHCIHLSSLSTMCLTSQNAGHFLHTTCDRSTNCQVLHCNYTFLTEIVK